METHEFQPKPVSEAAAFPLTKEDELLHLREMATNKNLEIKPIGEVGYIVFNPDRSYIADAPLVLIDWDDTAARTSRDKEQCWAELAGMGMDDEVIAYCDKISRVILADEEATYEPELEMRLLSVAQETRKNGLISLTPELKKLLQSTRTELLAEMSLDDHAVSPDIQELYDRTRFSSTLYPDTLQTIERLNGTPDDPHNVALLTYGDPSFQGAKVFETLAENNLKFALLTTARKGKFFQELLNSNVLAEIPLEYHREDTPRDVGVKFSEWDIPVMLFDDDPKQVASFRSIAESEGIAGLGVVRVRRQGIKRADQVTQSGKMIAEIRPSDTYLDSELFDVALAELKARIHDTQEFDKWFDEEEGEIRQIAQLRRDNLILDIDASEMEGLIDLRSRVRRVFEGKDSMGATGYMTTSPSIVNSH